MITPEQTQNAWRTACAAARHFQLPFGRQAWQGQQGNWLGSGLGSSIDFQDHRAYLPGDDPRYIHWAAYARTGQLTMKLYRAEVAPLVDVMIDASASMLEFPSRAARTAELLAFCVASADSAASPLRIHAANGRAVGPLPADLVRASRWTEVLPAVSGTNAAPGPLPWRNSALKVLISDLLFPGNPDELIVPMTAGAGTAIVFCPRLAAEAALSERGNLQLIEVENGSQRDQRIDERIARRYGDAYARHFELWENSARKRGVLFAPVECEGDLIKALSSVPCAKGAVVLQS
jgi:uncharacterized protein (DUF58 family)